MRIKPQQRWRRLWRHFWWDAARVRRSLGPAALNELTQQVQRVESAHHGEICTCIEGALPWSYIWHGCSVRERAIAQFAKLRVWDTERNNGVLIYLLLSERAIEIVADRAFNGLVSAAEWQAVVHELAGALREQQWQVGLRQVVERVGELIQRLPVNENAPLRNELPDQPVLGG